MREKPCKHLPKFQVLQMIRLSGSCSEETTAPALTFVDLSRFVIKIFCGFSVSQLFIEEHSFVPLIKTLFGSIEYSSRGESARHVQYWSSVHGRAWELQFSTEGDSIWHFMTLVPSFKPPHDRKPFWWNNKRQNSGSAVWVLWKMFRFTSSTSFRRTLRVKREKFSVNWTKWEPWRFN